MFGRGEEKRRQRKSRSPANECAKGSGTTPTWRFENRHAREVTRLVAGRSDCSHFLSWESQLVWQLGDGQGWWLLGSIFWIFNHGYIRARGCRTQKLRRRGDAFLHSTICLLLELTSCGSITALEIDAEAQMSEPEPDPRDRLPSSVCRASASTHGCHCLHRGRCVTCARS